MKDTLCYFRLAGAPHEVEVGWAERDETVFLSGPALLDLLRRLKQNLVDAVGCQPLPCRGAETLANAFLVFGRENGEFQYRERSQSARCQKIGSAGVEASWL